MPSITLKDPDAFEDLLAFSSEDIDIQNRGAKRFELASDDHVLTFSGSDFEYNNGVPVSGTVDQLKFETDDGTGLLTIKQIGLSVEDVLEAVQTGDFDDILSKPVTLKGSTGDDVFVSGSGDDRLFGLKGDDSLNGAAGDDQLTGGTGNDLLTGGGGNDDVGGSEGDDVLLGGAGKDKLSGAQGNDSLDGGFGKDELDGGSGSDTFLFTSAKQANGDKIVDFNRNPGGDVLDFRGFDADVGTAGHQSFTFIHGDAFNGVAGELRVQGSKIMGDIDGDGAADFTINSKNASLLDDGHFLLA